MIVFQNKKEFVRKNFNLEEDTVSTLLIPEHLMDVFFQRTKKYERNSVTLYLRSLLRRFRIVTHSGMIPDPEKLKTTYQDRGLRLQKVSFTPRNEDWLELGELALAFGKSRCWVFAFLLKLDAVDMWRSLVVAGLKKIVPMIPSLELKVFQRLKRFLYTFSRGYHVKV